MARLEKMPELDIIAGYKGKIDFYYWKGIPVARAWPKSPGRHRSTRVAAQWPAFTYAAREWANLDPIVQAGYREMAYHGGLSGRDLQVRSYLTGLFRPDIP